MKAIKHIILMSLFFVGCTYANDSQKIKALISNYEIYLNASDTKSVLNLYAEHPVFMPQYAPAQIGRKAVKQAYKNVFNTISLDIRFTTHTIEILGDTAWARTSSAGKTTLLANGAMINEGNNELFIFKKENNHWKIKQYLFSTNQPRK